MAEKNKSIRVLAWSELTEPKSVYPNGINGALAEYLNTCEGIVAKTANIDEPEQGVSEKTLKDNRNRVFPRNSVSDSPLYQIIFGTSR